MNETPTCKLITKRPRRTLLNHLDAPENVSMPSKVYCNVFQFTRCTLKVPSPKVCTPKTHSPSTSKSSAPADSIGEQGQEVRLSQLRLDLF
eukprot:735722-Pyramimonas_sp.AAC.1